MAVTCTTTSPWSLTRSLFACCWRAQVNTAAIEGVPLQMQPGGLISVDDCSVCLPTAVDHEKAQL